MRINPRLLGAFALAFHLFFCCASLAQQPVSRGITPEDYYAFEFVSDPQISPDGELVAYVITKVDRGQNRRATSIWMAAIDGSRSPWQFTTSPQPASAPRWSPNGRWLAFLSSRPGDPITPTLAANPGASPMTAPGAPPSAPTPSPTTTPGVGAALPDSPRAQVFALSMSGGEAHRVTNLKNGVSTFRWSPDSNRMVVVSRIGPSDGRPENRERSDVRHYKHTSYKFNDTGWFDDRRTHLWVVDVKTGNAKQITEGNDWNDSDPHWSPDGTRLAFVSNRTGKEYDLNRNTDVWVIPSDGGPLTKISDLEEADNSPRWSPDGKTIAYLGVVQQRDHPKIWLAPAAGGAGSVLAANALDVIPGGLEWSDDGKSLYFEAGVRGETHLFRVDVAKKSAVQVTSGAQAIRNVDFHWPTRTMVANDFKHLDDLYVANLNERDERRLTNLNEALWKQLKLADVERFSYKRAPTIGTSTPSW
ncbi:hypothetical protein BH18ACI4_BH18ACI4_12040 [soil metagenome]